MLSSLTLLRFTTLIAKLTEQTVPEFMDLLRESLSQLKGIVQPFEMGGETRLIRSAVKYWKPGKF
jgi:hypothetical protein